MNTEESEEVLFAGWLTKKGGCVKTWKARFCVITDETFRYYEDDTQTILRGTFDLETVIALNRRSPPLRSPIFEIEIPNRVYSFQALHLKEMEFWLKLIQSSHPAITLTKTPQIVQQGIIKDGILNKMGQVHKAWQTRKFTLLMFPVEQLVYCTADGQNEERGCIELRHISSVERSIDDECSFQIDIGTRMYLLQAETHHEMIEWIQLITAATRDAIWQAVDSDKLQLQDAQRRSQLLENDVVYKRETVNRMRVVKQGWLNKRGYYNRSWRRRYFVLQMECVGKPTFRYFLFPDTSVPRGSIELSQMKDIKIIDNTCKIEITLPKRTFELEAESEIEAHEWVTKIHFATKEKPNEY